MGRAAQPQVGGMAGMVAIVLQACRHRSSGRQRWASGEGWEAQLADQLLRECMAARPTSPWKQHWAAGARKYDKHLGWASSALATGQGQVLGSGCVP